MTADQGNGDEPVKVSLSKNNWIAIVGLMAGWLVAFVGAYVKMENRMTRIEAANEYLIKQVERLNTLTDKRP